MEPVKQVSELVRQFYSTFVGRDREAFEQLMHERFAFHSPHDPHLDKRGFFERCWPNGDRFRAFHIEKLFVEGQEAFVRYEVTTKAGDRFRNTEFLRVEDDKLRDVEVYYGSLPS